MDPEYYDEYSYPWEDEPPTFRFDELPDDLKMNLKFQIGTSYSVTSKIIMPWWEETKDEVHPYDYPIPPGSRLTAKLSKKNRGVRL